MQSGQTRQKLNLLHTTQHVWWHFGGGSVMARDSWYRQTSYNWLNDEWGHVLRDSWNESAAIHQGDEDKTWVDLPAGQRSETLSWFECPSPWLDLNPAEHLWKELKVRVNKRAPEHFQDLKTICLEEWLKITPEHCSFFIQEPSWSCHYKQRLLHASIK